MKNSKKFIPGLRLSELYFQKEIKPILEKSFSNLKYSAALFGWGSETLGYDTPRSADHHWGPRLLIFLKEEDLVLKEKISEALSNNLPYEFMGYSTNFSKPAPNGVRIQEKISSGPVNHMIDIFTIKSFFELRLNFDPYQNIEVKDWLIFPQQKLLELTSGKVYFDGLGNLNEIRKKFEHYPHDIWLYLLSCQWNKIAQKEAFVGRCGETGDELGSQIIVSRLVQEIMELCFLMEKKYIPYSKWFGTAFSKLKCSKKLSPIFNKVLLSKNWKEREKWLSLAYEFIAKKHNSLKITQKLSTKVTYYFDRPYFVINADKFSATIKNYIKSEEIKNIKNDIGSIDQFTDNTDIFDLDTIQKFKNIF